MSSYGRSADGTYDPAMSREPVGVGTAQYEPTPPGFYPPQPGGPYGYGGGQPEYGMNRWHSMRGMRHQNRHFHQPTETKPFYLTSEFVASVLVVAGIAITAASSSAFGAWRAWVLITAVAVAYLLSRGIAKAGTRSPAMDPRDEIDYHFGREHAHDPRHVHDGPHMHDARYGEARPMPDTQHMHDSRG